MAEEVAALLIKFNADMTSLKTELENVKKAVNQFGNEQKRQFSQFQKYVKSLKEPISNVAQLANSLGTAFGGAASKATGLVNGIVSSFSAGGGVGLAIGAVTGLVGVLISKFQEAREAAEKARQAAVDEQIASAKTVEEAIKRANDEIANINAKLGRGEDADTQKAIAAAKESEATAAEDLAKAQGKVVAAQAELDRLAKSTRDADALKLGAAQDALNAAKEGVTQADLELDRRKANNKTLGEALERLRLLRREEAAGADKPKSTPTKDAAALTKADEKARKESLAKFNETAAKYEQDRAVVAGVIQQTADEKAIAAFQERQEKILNLSSEFDGVRAELLKRNEIQLQDELAQIRADATERALKANKPPALDEDAIARAKQEAADLLTTSSFFADTIGNFVGSLAEGFSSLADFANKLKGLIVGIIAQLLQAVAVAALLSLFTGGVGLAGVGGLTGAVGRGLGIKGFAAGGSVGATDTVPAMLTPGEYVMPAAAVRAFGVDFMDNVRRAGRYGFADGGLVGRPGVGGSGGGDTYIVQAFDVPAIARNAGRLDTAQTRRISSNAGALYRDKLRRNLRG